MLNLSQLILYARMEAQRGLCLVEREPELGHHRLRPRQSLSRASATEDDEVVSIRDTCEWNASAHPVSRHCFRNRFIRLQRRPSRLRALRFWFRRTAWCDRPSYRWRRFVTQCMVRPRVARGFRRFGSSIDILAHDRPALFEFGTGFLPPETDAQKGARGDVSKQRPEIGDHDAREMAAKTAVVLASCQLRVSEDWVVGAPGLEPGAR